VVDAAADRLFSLFKPWSVHGHPPTKTRDQDPANQTNFCRQGRKPIEYNASCAAAGIYPDKLAYNEGSLSHCSAYNEGSHTHQSAYNEGSLSHYSAYNEGSVSHRAIAQRVRKAELFKYGG
jgi:hypothetical protein